MNDHWHCFRAKDTAGRVTITDWESQDKLAVPEGNNSCLTSLRCIPIVQGKNRRCRLSENDVL